MPGGSDRAPILTASGRSGGQTRTKFGSNRLTGVTLRNGSVRAPPAGARRSRVEWPLRRGGVCRNTTWWSWAAVRPVSGRRSRPPRAAKKVAVVERHHVVGGTRVNWGTIPIKTLRESAVFFYSAHARRLHGIRYEIRGRAHRRRLHAARAGRRAARARADRRLARALRAWRWSTGTRASSARTPWRCGAGGGELRTLTADLLRDRHRLEPEPARRRAVRRRDGLRRKRDPRSCRGSRRR